MARSTVLRTIERWNRIVHRWASIGFVLSLAALFFTDVLTTVTVILLVVMLVTGIVMLVRYYQARLRRPATLTRA